MSSFKSNIWSLQGKFFNLLPVFGHVKATMPIKLLKEIEKDNFHYQMEQQIYSKEFLGFVADITT